MLWFTLNLTTLICQRYRLSISLLASMKARSNGENVDNFFNGKLVDRKGNVSILWIDFDVSNEKDLLTGWTMWSLSFFYIKYGKANNFDRFFVFDLDLATRVSGF